jgi:hypothetical protein
LCLTRYLSTGQSVSVYQNPLVLRHEWQRKIIVVMNTVRILSGVYEVSSSSDTENGSIRIR